MVEKTGKRMPTSSSLGLISDKISGGLDFSKGFTYKNQDLDSVHSSADEISSLNRKRMEQHLGMEISKEEPSDEYIRNYARSLTGERSKIANNLASQGYDFNESVAYLDNYERLGFSNPMGKGLEIFQKEYQPSNRRDVMRGIEEWVFGTELGGDIVSSIGDTIYDFTSKNTKRDIDRGITDDTAAGRYKYAESRYNKVTKQINGLKEGDERLEGLLKEQEKWAGEMEKYNRQKRATTVDVFEEAGVSGTDYEKAVGAGVEEYKLWQEEVQPLLDSASTRYKKIDYIDKLTPDRFPDVNEAKWKEYYEPIIEKWKEAYSDLDDISLQELQDWKRTYKPSNDNINGQLLDTKEGAYRRLEDEMHNILRDEVKSELDKIKQGAGASYEKYSRFEEGLADVKKGAEKYGKSEKTKSGVIKNWARGKANKLGSALKWAGDNLKPSALLEKGLSRLGVPVETVMTAVNVADKGEKAVSKVWKGGGKLLGAIAPILDVVAFTEEASNSLERAELMEMPVKIQQKLFWKEGLAKGAPYENWTEEDWEDYGAGQEAIRQFLDSDEFERWLDLTTYKWTGARDRAKRTYMEMYY